jgi:hypothetical protein
MSKNRNKDDLQIAERMRAVGVPLDLGEFEESLIVTQEIDPGANMLTSCYLSRNFISTVIIAYINIKCISKTPLIISDFSLRLPWRTTPVTLLPDPAAYFAPQTYRFSKHNATKHDRSEMIQQSGTLRFGQSIKGFLMGTHGDRIEDNLKQGKVVHTDLHINDAVETIHIHDLLLQVDLEAERGRKPPAVQRRNIFDYPDSKNQKTRAVR